MSDNRQQICGVGICGGQCKSIVSDGVWRNNPIAIQMLGICSALAVTTRLANALVMGAALIFVCVGSNLLVSLLRGAMPRRIRMIAEVAIIATFVIVFDLLLKAYYYPMSKQLGPYVGLIITNCIVMGRAEAFALAHKPIPSMVDGFANGLGYTLILGVIAAAREFLGKGEILGQPILSQTWYTPNQLMVLAPGAFFALGLFIAIMNLICPPKQEDAP